MSECFDVIVVGVGTMGAAACRHLAQRGVRVLGLEQFAIPHGQGAHHGHSRMIRLAYSEHPHYVPLLQRAYTLWDELERDSGYKLLHITGGLYMGTRDSDIISGAVRSSIEHDLPYELLDPAALQSRYPQFVMGDDVYGFYEQRAGVLIPERVMCAHVELALRDGAQLRGHEAVRDWSSDAHGVTVRTDGGTYHAERIIFAGGAWSGKLVADLAVPLTVTRQTLAWFWPKRCESFALGTVPAWFIGTGDGFGYYGFPMLPDNPGFKIALHQPAQVTDPDTVVRHIMPGDEEQVRSILRQHIPQADGQLLAIRVCLYTNSPDHHFIVDTHPAHPRAIIACGFSGHGFKFASVIGEALADLATRGQTDHPIRFLGLSRFFNV